jgi:hypothetical protein
VTDTALGAVASFVPITGDVATILFAQELLPNPSEIAAAKPAAYPSLITLFTQRHLFYPGQTREPREIREPKRSFPFD